MKYLNIYIGVINLLTFIVFSIDKYKAKKKYYRISEKTLFILCFIGGGLGGLLGMRIMRHKIRKWYFNLLVPVSMVLLGYGYYYIYNLNLKEFF